MSEEITIPIFPLNGVILFPRTNLPLNIFERRYLEMIDYSLAKDKKIGMIQTTEKNDFYKIGCLGKIHTYEETADGRYLINILGEEYFSIIKEEPTKTKFKVVKAKIYKPNKSIIENIQLDDELIDSLTNKYFNFIRSENQEIDVGLFKKINHDTLIKFISMSSPFTVAEKQMLLETYGIKILAKKLIALLDYYLTNTDSSESIN